MTPRYRERRRAQERAAFVARVAAESAAAAAAVGVHADEDRPRAFVSRSLDLGNMGTTSRDGDASRTGFPTLAAAALHLLGVVR